tara:strand:- start:112 stop:582 length:471 start_codon:yes stop_codon:yes gene_type:complete
MKITKSRLKEIIREELSAERWATVPQVQRYAADAGVKLSYGDAKALAAKTPAERGALIRLQQAFKNGRWSEMMDEGYREDMTMPAISMDDMEDAMATSDEKFTGGSPEERLLTLIKARELLTAMSKEELTQLSLNLDGETTRALQHLLANPMYKEQ